MQYKKLDEVQMIDCFTQLEFLSSRKGKGKRKSRKGMCCEKEELIGGTRVDIEGNNPF